MTVTATEFKKNFGKYLELSRTEDIYITKNNKRIAKVSNPAKDRLEILEGLIGIAASDNADRDRKLTVSDIREERLAGK